MDGWVHPILFLAGLAAGFVDSIAGGGGLITVPVLLWAGLPAPLALGTNKMQAACGTSLAVWTYARAGLVRWPEVRWAVFVTFAAAVLGSGAVTRLDAAVLRQIIPWLLLGVALYTAFRPDFGALRKAAVLRAWPFALICGTTLGFYDGFFGPGTGSFWTLAFVGLLGLDLREATARTKVVNLASNAAALMVFLAAAQIRFDVALIMIAGQLIGARAGARLVVHKGVRFIRPVFLTMVFALTCKLLWDQWRER